MEQNRTQQLMDATEAGSEWALALKVGDTFWGCAVEAKTREALKYDSQLIQAFINGAMDILGRMVMGTDGNGVLVTCETLTAYQKKGGR